MFMVPQNRFSRVARLAAPLALIVALAGTALGTAAAASHARTEPGADAVAVARAFFADYANDGPDKLHGDPDWARQYFYTDLAGMLARGGFGGGSLYGGQDHDISKLRARSDPDHPPLRGMTTVLVTYRDWGKPQHMRLFLRSDPHQGGAQRIFRIETADGRTIW
jgi:hypothetical protein